MSIRSSNPFSFDLSGMHVVDADGAPWSPAPQATAAPAQKADDPPFCALRFGLRYTEPDAWPDMRAALAKNRQAFDDVWFSTGISFPPLSWHENHARSCAAAAADLRALGIVPSIEIQTIIGHTDGILDSGDCSGQDWGTWVGADGTVSRRVSCPHDPRLAAYFARVGELHAAWKPGSVWFDDDVTLRNRAPMRDPSQALFGCFCDRCLADFAKRDGRSWVRGELAEAIRRDPSVAARWEAFQCENFAALCRTIAEAVHRISPETVFGYQYGFSGRPTIVKGIFDGCGIPVRLRPGAGAYWDTDPHDQLAKAYELQRLSEKMGHPDWIGARCPEIESCPRTFASRTPQGIILEAFENLALGMDFLSMFVADARTDESTAYYADRLFPRLAAAHPFLKDYRDANADTRPCGFSVAGDEPAKLVACRGIPIIGANGLSLGPLPDVASIPIRMAGSGEVDTRSPEYGTRVMQIASSTGLLGFRDRCDRACGGRLPVLFEGPVMAFAMPRLRKDGTLATLALVNASIDRQDPIGIRLRGVPADVRTAVWHQPEAAPVPLGLERRDGETFIRLPRIGAWECGYLAFE